MIDLKACFDHRYKIRIDESASIDRVRANRRWYYQIPCRYGHVYVHGPNLLGGFTDRRNVISRLIALPGTTLRQRGDSEATVTFPPELLDQAAQLLQARKRRRVSPERAAQSAERLRQWQSKRTQVSPRTE